MSALLIIFFRNVWSYENIVYFRYAKILITKDTGSSVRSSKSHNKGHRGSLWIGFRTEAAAPPAQWSNGSQCACIFSWEFGMSLSENLSISETSESRGMTAVTEKTSLTEVAPAQQPRLKAARRAQWTSLPPDVLIPHEICHRDQGFLPNAPPPPLPSSEFNVSKSWRVESWADLGLGAASGCSHSKLFPLCKVLALVLNSWWILRVLFTWIFQSLFHSTLPYW